MIDPDFKLVDLFENSIKYTSQRHKFRYNWKFSIYGMQTTVEELRLSMGKISLAVL